jgi:cysteine-rich PDZ-binding protein
MFNSVTDDFLLLFSIKAFSQPAMVCDKCLAKQKAKGQNQGTIVSDSWKEGANNYGKVQPSDKRITSKEINNPYTKSKDRTCKICKVAALQDGHYCTTCAFKKGICRLCGKKVVNTTTEYRSTNA